MPIPRNQIIETLEALAWLKREDAWTKYACASAAAFNRAFLRTRPIELAFASSSAVETSHTESNAGSCRRGIGTPTRHPPRGEA